MINRKTHREEEKVNLDRYLITYSDLITLLLGLFVILYASSQVSEERFKDVSKAFSDYFQSSNKEVVQGGSGVNSGFRNSIPEPIFPFPMNKTDTEIKKETEDVLKNYINQGLVGIKMTEEGLTLTLSEKLLFQSGSANIQPKGLEVLDSLASILRGIDKVFKVDGHTDAQPIRTFKFESNWHLSVARALNVGYSLIAKGLPEQNVVIRGFGSQKPVAENSTYDGRTMNRRVEIAISDNLDKNGSSPYNRGDMKDRISKLSLK